MHIIKKTYFDGVAAVYEFRCRHTCHDMLRFIREMQSSIIEALTEQLQQNPGGIRWIVVTSIEFTNPMKRDKNGIPDETAAHFWTLSEVSHNMHGIHKIIDKGFAKMQEAIESFLRKGSGWVFKRCTSLDLKMMKYQPLKPTAYISLPKGLLNKRSLLNIQNRDEKCFIWCVLAALHPIEWNKHANRVTKYKQYEKELNMKGIKYPVTLKQIDKFERQNEHISINIYGYTSEIIPLRISKLINRQHNIDILLIKNQNKQHYVLIRNFNMLLNTISKNGHRQHFCRRCLQHFGREDLLSKHMEYCFQNQACKIQMPSKENNILKFNKSNYSLKKPYVAYADFECFNIPEQRQLSEKVKQLTVHKASGFSLAFVNSEGKLIGGETIVYRGPDVVKEFLGHLFGIGIDLLAELQSDVGMQLTAEEQSSFEKSRSCHICEREFAFDDRKVRDHDHITGKFRGAAHNICNLNYRNNMNIPVFYHGLRHYDAHVLLKEAGTELEGQKITVIPNTMEQYVSFNIGPFQFLDSLQFMAASLETLVNNLKAGTSGAEKFPILRQCYPDERDQQLLLRKGVFPYEYLTSADVFEEQQLPPRAAFYSRLRGEEISKADYHHAQAVWYHFDMGSFGDYHDLYLKSDVILLADVVENFRRLCMDSYKIDPSYVFSAPGFTWQAGLRHTKVELELLTDIDMYQFFERGIRGGVSTIIHRHGKANNKYMTTFDPAQPSKYLMYFDMNNLYGFAMMQKLPCSDFKWLTESEIKQLNVDKLDPEGEYCYILEVDLSVPAEHHERMNQLSSRSGIVGDW